MNKKIIIADMSPDYRRYLTKYIAEIPGITVDEVDLGFDLIEKTKKENYDAIIADLLLSDMSSIRSVREIRMYDQRSPILIMSLSATRFIDPILSRLPVNVRLYKPFGKTEFLESLEKLL